MEKYVNTKALCECGSNKVKKELDLSSIVNVDTVLISSRHMYRMPYSLPRENRISVYAFDIKHILKIQRKTRQILKNSSHTKFLDRTEAKLGRSI